MRDRRVVVVSVAAVAGLAGSAAAQFDNSVWPGFRGGAVKRGAVNAPGPAINHAFTVTGVGTASGGGFSVAANGDVYFMTHYTGGPTKVIRMSAADGSILAQSANFGGVIGNHAGVAVGVDAVYSCIFRGAGNTSVVKLNKSTLATIQEWTDPRFGGLRGTPLIGSVRNNSGNVNLYIHDRGNTRIYAMDSVTGAVKWEYTPIYSNLLGQMGPMWTGPTGKQRFAYFGNGDLGPGVVLEDNGDSTFSVVWDAAGPGNFNWFGCGALSADGDNIYVTTFNDNFTPSLWSIDANNGGVLWSVPGNRGVCGQEYNFFGRPSVVGNRVYCAGGQGVIACFIDNGNSYTTAWEYRDYKGEHTAVSVARTPGGETYVYAVKQELLDINPLEPCAVAPELNIGELVVLKDEGGAYTEVLRTSLGGAMRQTFFANNSAMIDAEGGLWIAGGDYRETSPGDVYKFRVGGACPCACNYDTTTGPNVCDIFDFLEFQNRYDQADPCACNEDTSTGPNVCDIFDFLEFQNGYSVGCP